jgi:hypothetical protein
MSPVRSSMPRAARQGIEEVSRRSQMKRDKRIAFQRPLDKHCGEVECQGAEQGFEASKDHGEIK